MRAWQCILIAISMGYVLLSVFVVRVLLDETALLTKQLNDATAKLATRAVIRPDAAECAAWWFNTDIARAKERICKQP